MIDVVKIVVYLFAGYVIVDMIVFVIHKITATEYWKNKGQPSIYSFLPFTNIPTAICCWIKFGNPLATWKLIEEEETKI